MSQYARWPATGGGGGSGTVTSVAVTSSDSSIDVTGSPITVSGTIDITLPLQTASTVAGFDSSGVLTPIPGFAQNADKGLNITLTEEPDGNSGGKQVFNINVGFEPLQNSPNESWLIYNNVVNLDPTSTGFTFGTNGNAVTINNNTFLHSGTGNVGNLAFTSNTFELGNGTDPITIKGIGYSFGFGSVHANATVTDFLQGYGFQASFDPAATFGTTGYVSGFYDAVNAPIAMPSYTSFSAGPTIGSINNNNGYTAFNSNAQITTLTGNSGYTGVAISPQVTTVNTGFVNGVSINPTVTTNNGNTTGVIVTPSITLNNGNSVGLDVNMSNVTNYAGVPASLVEQDITYTFYQSGAYNNSYTITYADTTTAGNETVTIMGFAITVNIESGVSTATQVKAAWDANLPAAGAVNAVITGTASNPQVAAGPDSFAGGINPGTSKAAQFTGDVSINGALSFTGALSVGEFDSFAAYAMASGTGSPASIDTLITAPSVAASATLTAADLLAVNTAMLLNIGNSATVTTNFLGVTALGLPAVVTMGTGSTVDRVGGAVFAISLDASATGGAIAEVDLCRSIAIPNGITTVTELKGYLFDLPFGDPGTTTWGLYSKPATAHNYMAGDLKIGSGADTPANSSVALEIESTSKVFLNARLSNAEQAALTPVNGMMMYNTDTDKLQVYAGGAWVDLH